MKFLFHSENAAWDDNTKTWSFTLNERIHNPVQLDLEHISFTPSGSVRPNCIYVRSNCLSQLLRTQTTREVKTYQTPSNIVAVLVETHNGRYTLRNKRTFPLQPNHSSKIIDFQFTDGTTPLNGIVVQGASTQSVSTGSDEAIEEIHAANDLILWMDFQFESTTLNASFQPVTGINTGDIKYLRNRAGAPGNVLFTTPVQTMSRALLGDNSYGIITQYTYDYTIDSTNNPTFPDNCSWGYLHLLKTPPQWKIMNVTDTNRGLMWQFSTGGEIISRDINNNIQTVNGITYFPADDVLVTIVRKQTDGVWEHHWTWTRLVDGSVQTAVAVDGPAFTSGNVNGYDLKFGHAAQGIMDMVIGPCILYINHNDNYFENAKAHLLALYNGAQQQQEEETVAVTNASFVVDLDIETN